MNQTENTVDLSKRTKKTPVLYPIVMQLNNTFANQQIQHPGKYPQMTSKLFLDYSETKMLSQLNKAT